MAKIRLTGGLEAIVDDEDLDLVSKHNWFSCGRYACCYRRDPNQAHIMQRMIMTPPPHLIVHHRNGNGLDNRRSNLLICSRKEHGEFHVRHKEPGELKQFLTVSIPKELYLAVRHRRNETGRSISHVMRKALEAWVEESPEAREVYTKARQEAIA